jgi:YidC/Oxa1 family membrane protein insertase
MEKRLLLAFLISFSFLYLWSSFAPKPPAVVQKSVQPQANNTDKILSSPPSSPASLPPTNEQISIIENNKLKVELTNIGGFIKKITLKEYNITLPAIDFLKIQDLANSELKISSNSQESIKYILEKDNVRIERTYSSSNNSYLLNSELAISGKMSKEEKMDGFTLDISSLDNSGNNRDKNLYEYSIETEQSIHRKENATKFNKKEDFIKQERINWIGFRDRYFCAIVKPIFNTTGYEVKAETDKILRIFFNTNGDEQKPENEKKLNIVIYYGPQKLNLLQSYNMGIENIMKFSNWQILDAIAKVIDKGMNGLHNYFPNWGVCILLISLIIYGAMYPLTIQSMSSMKRMQALQPKINQIREQYKNNPQRLNKEIMDLYKENKVNPFGGCLPLIFQMPVFIGLYQVLWRSVAFKGAKFLWIKDLSEPDRLFILPYTLPIIGNEINLLPIIMMFAMALQQKISAKNMTTTDPTQATQQKMMMTVFPVFIGFIFYKFASGLCLYFTLFYLLSTFTQYKVAKATKAA